MLGPAGSATEGLGSACESSIPARSCSGSWGTEHVYPTRLPHKAARLCQAPSRAELASWGCGTDTVGMLVFMLSDVRAAMLGTRCRERARRMLVGRDRLGRLCSFLFRFGRFQVVVRMLWGPPGPGAASHQSPRAAGGTEQAARAPPRRVRVPRAAEKRDGQQPPLERPEDLRGWPGHSEHSLPGLLFESRCCGVAPRRTPRECW